MRNQNGGFVLLMAIWILNVACTSKDLAPDINSGLIAYYKFRGDTRDYSGAGNDLVSSDVSYGVDRHGVANAAIRFDGKTSYASTKSPTNFKDSDFVTVSMWVYSTEPDTSSQVSLILTPVSGPFSEFSIWDYTGATGTVVGSSYGTVWSSALVAPISRNSWHHLAILVDVQHHTARLYIDKAMVQQATFSFDSSFQNFNWWLAHSPGWQQWWQGSIANLRMYNRLLSEDEVAALYNE